MRLSEFIGVFMFLVAKSFKKICRKMFSIEFGGVLHSYSNLNKTTVEKNLFATHNGTINSAVSAVGGTQNSKRKLKERGKNEKTKL